MGEDGRDAAGTQIAIDGAAGVGKSTVGERVARRLGYLYIDSGAFYRALTLLAQRRGVAFDDEPALLTLIAEAPIRIAPPAAQSDLAYSVYAGADTDNLAPALHNLDVTRAVSTVARIPSVRAALIARMREMANAHSVVMVGRDIGKVVLPDAPVKIALTAPADERARRRHADLVAALGDGAPALAQVLEDIEARDRKDAGQMDLAPDAISIENRDGQLDAVVDRISALAQPAPAQPQHETLPAVSAPAAEKPRASSREGAYVAPPVAAPRDIPWNGVTHPRFYRVVQTLAGMVFPLFFKLRIEGRENIPTTGSVMLAANHVAWIDIPLLAQPLRRFTHYMAKAELFQVPVVGYIIGMCGNFPVRRGEGDRESLRVADRLLTSGEVVAIFPEGHRTGGALIRGLPGVALIALRADAPVVPVGIINSNEVFKKGRIIFNRPTVTIRYGKPFTLAKSGARHSKADLERGIDTIMTQIAALLPQEYHGVYGERLAGASQPAELAAPAPASGDSSAPRV